MALNETCRGFVFAGNQCYGLIIELVAGLIAGAARQAAGKFWNLCDDFFEVGRLALIFEELHDMLDLFIGNERSMDTGDAPAAFHKQHVALAK